MALWALLVCGLLRLGGALPLGLAYGGGQLLARVGFGGLAQLAAQERVERRGQLAPNRIVLINQQPVEEREVELAAHGAGCLAVGGGAVPGEVERPVHVRLGLAEVGVDLCQARLDGGQLGGDDVLLALEQVERDGFGQVRVQQRLALFFELALAALLRGAFVLGVQTQLGQFFFEEGAKGHQLVLLKLDGGVVRDDGLLDKLNPERALVATVLVLLATDADEVRVDAAPASRVVDDQAGAAGAAVEAALEVVVVLALLLADEVLGREQVLDLVPGFRGHEPVVLAGIEHASVAHHPRVVGVAQQSV